jgi:antagonist of KipI
MADIEVINGGLFTTVQDKGRYGYQQYGMPVAGAMDEFSLRIANILVGNDEYEAAFEMTMNGPELLFNVDTAIAITGADMTPRINGNIAPMWRAINICKGDMLTFETAKSGIRGYIAFVGGLDIPAVMGSRSTFIRGGIGGVDGRKLKAGDELNIIDTKDNIEVLVKGTVPQEYIPKYDQNCIIRVVLGPQDDCFTDESIEKLVTSEYEVTNEADRMGYRLSGPKLEHKSSADIISDGITMGAIQIPGHGMPIVMMADRQTTGGYAKIANVISSDLPLMAQLKPGDKVRFKYVSIQEAHRILREYESKIESIKKAISYTKIESTRAIRYNIKVMGKHFDVLVKEIY